MPGRRRAVPMARRLAFLAASIIETDPGATSAIATLSAVAGIMATHLAPAQKLEIAHWSARFGRVRPARVALVMIWSSIFSLLASDDLAAAWWPRKARLCGKSHCCKKWLSWPRLDAKCEAMPGFGSA